MNPELEQLRAHYRYLEGYTRAVAALPAQPTYALIEALCDGCWDGCDTGELRIGGETFSIEKHLLREELNRRNTADLTKLHTRQLLAWLRYARACGGGHYVSVGRDKSYGADLTALYAELATREHVPSKLEGRKLRQEAARASRRGKSRSTLRRAAGSTSRSGASRARTSRAG